MRIKDWLEFFRRHQKEKIFYFQHLKLLTGMSSHSLRMALKRLADKKIIRRICRGYYANPFNLPALEEVAAVIYSPSYISMESALSRYGILSQMPQVLTCVTTRLPRKFNTALGVIEYRQMKKTYFFGFIQEQAYFIAEPEKALIDYLYLNKCTNIQGMVQEFGLEGLRHNRLKAYAAQLKISVNRLINHKVKNHGAQL